MVITFGDEGGGKNESVWVSDNMVLDLDKVIEAKDLIISLVIIMDLMCAVEADC